MADPTAVAQVLELLGPDAPANGWNDIRVGQDLDNALTPNAIALAWWKSRMAQTANMMDTSEGGSSRSMSQAWQHAQSMVTYYQQQVQLETPIDQPRGVLRSYKMRRV